MPLNLEQRQLLAKARLLGAGTALPVYLSDEEVVRLVCVILADVGKHHLIPKELDVPGSSGWDYYYLPLSWFTSPAPSIPFPQLYEGSVEEVQDFETYFKCLCELHKRRRKYEMILRAQPLPTPVQISPRALLEFGVLASPALGSWLTWRKWFYDIDNRAAQETGYLFEPILTSALGGASVSARYSPVRRRSDPRKGRQVDCILGSDAYEFKMRVTPAASGQGRFAQELEFAQDCLASQLRPILLVLDPTPSDRLDDLAAAYRGVGGEAHVGDSAWEHIERRSGPTMATFVEKYVRRPIASLDAHMTTLLDLRISSDADQRRFEVQIGEEHSWIIPRREDPRLEETDDDES